MVATRTFWFSPFPLIIGLMAILLCATLAAIYLTVEATNAGQTDLAETYRKRGLITGAITAVLGAVGILLSPAEAPQLWQGMLNHAIPLVVVTMLIGLGAAFTLYARHYRIARILIVGETAFLLGSWGISQIPYLIPPDITVNGGAGAPSTLLLLLIGVSIGLLIILPSIYLLLYIFKLKNGVGLPEQGHE